MAGWVMLVAARVLKYVGLVASARRSTVVIDMAGQNICY